MADKYLTDRTERRTTAGAQLNPAGWTLGTAFPNGGKLYTVSICCGQDLLLRPSWSNGLQISPGDVEAMCRSGGQPETNSQDDED